MSTTPRDGENWIRAKSQDYKQWRLWDGNTQFDPTSVGVTRIVLIFIKPDNTVLKQFATDDTPQKLFAIGGADPLIELRPAADDFTVSGKYRCYAKVYDGAGAHSFPENKEYPFNVYPDYEE